MSFYNVSATAASNTTINSISAAGSASANLIDDLIRQLAAQDRQFANDLGGNNTVGGTADAITITPSSGSITAAFDGLVIGFVATADNTTTSPTANVGGLGAEPIKKADSGAEAALLAGDIQSGGFYLLRWRSSWDSANGAWELINPDSIPQGLAKIWASINTAQTALNDSFNVSSLTDTGTGNGTINHTNSMGNAFYPGSTNTVGPQGGGNSVRFSHVAAKSTSQTQLHSGYANSTTNFTFFDYAKDVSVHGDLA